MAGGRGTEISTRSRNGLSNPNPAPRRDEDKEGCLSSLKTCLHPSGFHSKAALPTRHAKPGVFGLFSLPSTNILPLPMFLSSPLDAAPAFHVVQTQYFFGCQGLCVTCRLGSVCSLDHKGTANAAQNVYGILRPRQICSTPRAPRSEHPGEAG